MNNDINLIADIPGLINIFGDSLYSDFGSVLRELVQNGHDAILLSGNNLKNKSVKIQWNDFESRLIVSDDGIGMTEDEIKKSLNNFASSDKKNMARDLNLDYAGLIGQYGVGFLSAMAASEHLIVLTWKNNENYLKWEYKEGNSTATIKKLTTDDFEDLSRKYNISITNSGTSVICNLKNSVVNKYDINEEEILTSLKKYLGLLPVDIIFNHEKINYSSLILDKDIYKNEEEWESIIYDLHNEKIKLLISLDDAPKEFQVDGILYIKHRSGWFSEPSIDFYIKGIFVANNPKNIIPEWANFIGGIINSNALSRIVSGENIKDNQLAREFKIYLEKKLLDTISKISKKSLKYYREILGAHDDTLKGKISDSPELLDNLWDKIPINATGRRSYILKDYLSIIAQEQSEDIIYIVEEEAEYAQAEIISNTTNIPILLLTNSKDQLFVNQIARKKSIKLESANTLAQHQFKVPKFAEKYDILINDCIELNLRTNIEARDFDPEYVPAILVNDPKIKEEKEQLLKAIKEANTKISSSVHKILDNVLSSKTTDSHMSFYLNTRNPLINNLLKSNNEETRKSILLTLYNIVFMNVYRDLNRSNTQIIYESIARTMSTLLKYDNKPIHKLNMFVGLSEKDLEKINNNQIIEDNYSVVIHDIIGSSWLISNLSNEATIIYKKFTDKLNNLAIEYKGYIDKFTGDGAIIVFKEIDNQDLSARRAASFSKDLINMTYNLYNEEEIRIILARNHLNFMGSRIAITYGKCSLANFGKKLSIFGKPLIEATRIINDQDLYETFGLILLTEEVYVAGNFRQNDTEIVNDNYIPRGLHKPLVISKLK